MTDRRSFLRSGTQGRQSRSSDNGSASPGRATRCGGLLAAIEFATSSPSGAVARVPVYAPILGTHLEEDAPETLGAVDWAFPPPSVGFLSVGPNSTIPW